jgi:hypothetical protein
VPFRIGIFDAVVAAIVLFVILLPGRDVNVRAAYRSTDEHLAHDIGMYQARLIADPSDGAAAQHLSELLVKAGQTDWALRVAGRAAAHKDSPTVWRSYLALSWAHADRYEMRKSHELAVLALEACGKRPATCPMYEKVRLEMYESGLEAGIKSGIDPRTDPKGFREASRTGTRFIHVKRGAPAPAPSPSE